MGKQPDSTCLSNQTPHLLGSAPTSLPLPCGMTAGTPRPSVACTLLTCEHVHILSLRRDRDSEQILPLSLQRTVRDIPHSFSEGPQQDCTPTVLSGNQLNNTIFDVISLLCFSLFSVSPLHLFPEITLHSELQLSHVSDFFWGGWGALG